MIGRRGLLGLGVAAAAMSAAAVWAYRSQPGLAAIRPGEPALPGLAEHADGVTRLAIHTGTTEFTVARAAATAEGSPSVWTLVERDNYPVRPQIVRGALVGLAELRLTEPRTARPELYSRIDVGDPGEGSRSLGVTASDAAGNPVGALIIGKTRSGQLGIAGEARYVRRPGEAQSWLATGSLEIPANPIDWLDRHLTNVARLRIREIVIEGPDRPELHIVRDAPTGSEFRIIGLPADRHVDRQYRVDNVATVLEGLDLADVRSANGLIPTEAENAAERPRATFTTFDGLVVTVTLTTPDPNDPSVVWATFQAAQFPPSAPAATPATPPAQGEPAATPPAQGAAPAPPANSEGVAREVTDINTRLAGWAYRLPPFKVDRLRSRIEDVTEAGAPAAAPGATPSRTPPSGPQTPAPPTPSNPAAPRAPVTTPPQAPPP